MYLALVKCTDNGYHDPHEMELLCFVRSMLFLFIWITIIDLEGVRTFSIIGTYYVMFALPLSLLEVNNVI